jgi:hypothetical protein
VGIGDSKMKKYEIFYKSNGETKSTEMVVEVEDKAVELTAIYNDIDAGTGVTYFYEEV